MCELCRRSFLGGMAAVGMAGVHAGGFCSRHFDTRFERAAVTLPQRGEFVITNATSSPWTRNLATFRTVRCMSEDGAIVAVGANVSKLRA